MAAIPGSIMLGMKWKADRTTIFAAVALVAAGYARIVFAQDLVLGCALVGLGIIIAVRAFLYFRKPDAYRITQREKSTYGTTQYFTRAAGWG